MTRARRARQSAVRESKRKETPRTAKTIVQQSPVAPSDPAARNGLELRTAQELEAIEKELQHKEELAGERLAVEAERLRYRDLFEFVPEAYVVTNRRGTVLEANGAAAALLGHPEEFIVGKPLGIYVSRTLARDFHLRIAELSAIWQRQIIEIRLRPRLGAEFDAELTVVPIRGADGELTGLRWLIRDITARKAKEGQMRRQNAELNNRMAERTARLAAIVDSSADAIIGLRIDGKIESWNPAAERLFGYTSNEVVGAPLSIIYPREWPDEFPRLLDRLQRGERVEHYETERVRQDGTHIFVSVSLSPVRDAAGQLIGAAKIVRDITALRREQEAARILSEASAVLVRSLDYKTTLPTVAQLAVPALGDYVAVDVIEAENSRRRVAFAAHDPETEELVQELLEHLPPEAEAQEAHRLLDSGQPLLVNELSPQRYLEGPAARLGEILRTLNLTSYLIAPLSVGGRTIGTISLGCLGSRRRYDYRDLAVVQDLAQRIAYAVDNARLYQESQAALIARDQFLSIASHEVRTPLTVIQGYTELLKRQLEAAPNGGDAPVAYDRAKLERTLQNIDYSTARLITLVGDLLDISRMRERGLRVTPEPVDLKQLLLKVIDFVRTEKQYRENKRDIRFDVQVPEQAVQGQWDHVRLEQVMVNLIENALKYTPSHEASVHVRLDVESVANGDGGGEHVAHLSVRDEGIGIPPEELGKMFQPFVRASNATEGHFPGLGLGLAVSKEIVVRHGGKIWVESEGRDRGSTFHVVLPGISQ
jgi:PAS domain S-box-containing protein